MAWHVIVLNYLIHAAVGGSLFLVAGVLAVRACRQPVRRVRLIELTLLGSLLVPCASQLSALPHWSVGWLTLTPTEPTTAPPSESTTTIGGSFEVPAINPASLAESAAPHAAAPPAATAARIEGTPAGEEGGEAPSDRAAGSPWLPTPTWTTEWISLVLVTVYALIAGMLFLRLLVGLAYLGWLRATARAAPAAVVEMLRQIAGNRASRVRLLASNRVELPLTFPGWRPIILLPAALCRADGDAAALRYGLTHEWSHVERGDIWRWHLATAAQFLFFYQPLFWWLRRQLRLCQDYLADARAVGQGAAEDYAEHLVALARRRLAVPVAALSISDRRSHLYRRIAMLLHGTQSLEQRCRRPWSLAVTVAAVLLLAACAVVRLDAAAPPAGEQAAPTKDTPPTDAKAKPTEKGETLRYVGCKVVDKDTGKGIAGATVVVRRSLLGDPELKDYNPLVEETKHTTDAEGNYSFTIPPEQSSKRYLYIELDVEHPDYAPQRNFGYALSMIRKNEKLGGRPFFERVELRPGKPITGLIQTPEGRPAAGVKVLAYSRTTKQVAGFEYGSFADTRTGADGRFRLTVTTPGEAIIWLLPKNYAPSAHKLKEGQRGDLGTFNLTVGITVKGQVLDAKGKPAAGVSVHVRRERVPPDEQVNAVADSIGRSALTDDKGQFTFAPLPPGEYRVYPEDRHYDSASNERRDRRTRPLPGVFLRQKLVLKDGEPAEPIEVRAVPHVVIEAQHYDGKGKKTRGHEFHIFGRLDGDFFFAEGKQDPSGKVTALVPHGLEQTQLNLMTNEHGVLRWRRTKDDPLGTARTINLGTVNEDVTGIEIIRYVAPIVVIKAVDKDKRQVKDFKTQVAYAPGKSPKEPGSMFVNGVQGDVYLEKQEDGRWRTSQLLPDETVTVTVSADGYEPKSETLKLAEGETKELALVLERAKGQEKKVEKKKGEDQ